tara:strand:+ start:5522 stop:6931 length:1410 start_codon:yes stop_codon:yes gene_type:complete
VKTNKNRNIDLKKNLDEKKKLIEGLKKLIVLDNKMNEKYLEFKKIQESWFKIGPVPRVNDGIIWNNFQHHVKNFYDYLHLNRKFKEIDIEYNLREKESLIKQAKELIKSEDKQKAYKYFERLNKKWKYEIGPIKKENDKDLNKKFSEIGEYIYSNKKEFDTNKDSILKNNLIKKEDLLVEMEKLINQKSNTTKEWQKKIKEFENIKRVLETTGPIPSNKKNEFWKKYKEKIKNYYFSKNLFYKNLKKIYKENILKQDELISKAKKLKENIDLEKSKNEIINLQKKWKNINPVPYKVNEKNWQQFKTLCNYFFSKMDEDKLNKIKEIKENQESQIKFLKNMKVENPKLNTDDLLKQWADLGLKSQEIDLKFEESILKIFKSNGLNIEDSKTKLFETKIQTMNDNDKNKKIISLNKEQELLKKQVSTLENNLSFFNEKSKENKLLNKVYNDIEKNKKRIDKINLQKKLLRT